MLEVFRQRGTRNVLLPLAVHPGAPWLLFEDGGTTMRGTRPDGTGDHDLAAWERILREYATLQRSLETPDAAAEMLAAGTTDGRPARLARELERLDDDGPWSKVRPEERDTADLARTRLRAMSPIIRARANDLAASGIAATIQHDDLHGGNFLVGPAGDRIFDWGDAVVAHPFGTLTTTFNSIAHKTRLSLEDPAFVRLRDVYLEAWSGVLGRSDLLEVTAFARDLACVGRSLAWERAFVDLEADEMGDRGDSVAGWLMELAERLDEPRWARRPG